MKKETIREYWRSEAEESLQVARHLFEKRDYSYALFFGHLAIEKILKAIYILKKDDNIPRTHNLSRIATAAGLNLEEEMVSDLLRITAFNLEARYPDYKRHFRKKCTREFTSNELDRIEEIFRWLKSIK